MFREAVLEGRASTGKTNKALFGAFSCRHDTSVQHSSRTRSKADTFNEMFILPRLHDPHFTTHTWKNDQRSATFPLRGGGGCAPSQVC